jgi:hypothetical protein
LARLVETNQVLSVLEQHSMSRLFVVPLPQQFLRECDFRQSLVFRRAGLV